MTNFGYYPKAIVGVFDIIGMKNLFDKKDKLETATKIVGQICGNIDLNKNHLKYHWRQYGDAVYLIANPKSEPEEQINTIAFCLAQLIAFGIVGNNLIECKFLSRSGIARGELSAAKWNGAKEPFFVGNSMRYAYELERDQDWFGGIIKSDINCSKMNAPYIIEYEKIPIKGNKTYKGYAINWVEAVKQIGKKLKIEKDITPNNLCKKIKDISDKIGYSTEEEKEKNAKKIQNTQDFIRFCLK